jgi:methyl-accepting chemotaxis protein
MVGGFFVAVLLSALYLYTLRDDLVYHGMIDSGRATVVYVRLYLVIGIAFALAYFAIRYLQLTKKETIVYLDKKIDTGTGHQGTGGGAAGADGLNTHALRDTIARAKSRDEKYQEALNLLCNQLNAGQGALFLLQAKGDKKNLALKTGFALVLAEGEQPAFEWAEGLVGQVAATGNGLYLDELPEGYAARIESGLGGALPKYLLMLPVKKEKEVTGVVEMATFSAVTQEQRTRAQEAVNILAEI